MQSTIETEAPISLDRLNKPEPFKLKLMFCSPFSDLPDPMIAAAAKSQSSPLLVLHLST